MGAVREKFIFHLNFVAGFASGPTLHCIFRHFCAFFPTFLPLYFHFLVHCELFFIYGAFRVHSRSICGPLVGLFGVGGHLPQARGGGDIGLYRFIRGSFVAHLWPADGSFRGLHRSGDAQ